MKPRSHIHDWQWSEEQECHFCACGEALFPVDAGASTSVPTIVSAQVLCWSCLGSGYSDYAVGKPCAECGGWGYWETIP